MQSNGYSTMLEPSNAAPKATKAVSLPLLAEARDTPISKSFLQGNNTPNSLASLCIKRIGVENFIELSTKVDMPQKLLQEVLKQELKYEINCLGERLQITLKHNQTIEAAKHDSSRRDSLELNTESWQAFRLPSPEAYRPLLKLFAKVEEELRGETYACPEGPALQSTKTLVQAIYTHAASHGRKTAITVNAEAILEALKDDTLPAELRQIAAAFFIDCVDYLPPNFARNLKCKLLRSIVKSMAPKVAATYLVNMADGMRTILLGNVFGMDADDKQMFNTLLDIADQHPNDRGRASLLVQLVRVIKLQYVWPDPVEFQHKKLEVFAHLPDKGEGCLNLTQAFDCLNALWRATDPRMRDDVQAAAKRIVESTEPLPANEADAIQAHIRSKLSHMTNVEELARLVPRQEAQ